MKKHVLTLVAMLGLVAAKAQTNIIFSNTEICNFGIVDISIAGEKWATERKAVPGYLSVMGDAGFTGASNGNNVDGYIKAYHKTSFSFPVGSGTSLQMLSISGAPADNIVATAWISGDPGTNTDPTDAAGMQLHPATSFGSDLNYVSSAGQWDWQDIGNNAAGTLVTVSIPALQNLNPSALASSLRLAGWNGTQWINLSIVQGAAAATGTSAGSQLTGTMQAGITALAVASNFKETNTNIKVLPNPASNYIQVTGVTSNSKIQVTDMLGQVVMPYGSSTIISLARFAKGQYVLQVLGENGQVQVFKFIKQ